MHLAVAKLDVESVRLLIKNGADINDKDSSSGDTPVHLLVNVYSKSFSSAREILEMLALNGADLNAKNNDLWTPLHLAVKKGSFDAVEALININSLKEIHNKVDIDA